MKPSDRSHNRFMWLCVLSIIWGQRFISDKVAAGMTILTTFVVLAAFYDWYKTNQEEREYEESKNHTSAR